MAALGWNSERSYLDSASSVTRLTGYDTLKLGVEVGSVVGGALFLKHAGARITPTTRTMVLAFGAAGLLGLTYRTGAALARVDRHQELEQTHGGQR